MMFLNACKMHILIPHLLHYFSLITLNHLLVAPQICTFLLRIHFHFRSLTLHCSLHSSLHVISQTGQEVQLCKATRAFPWNQSPRVDSMSSYDLGIILKGFGQRLDVQSSTVKINSSETLES